MNALRLKYGEEREFFANGCTHKVTERDAIVLANKFGTTVVLVDDVGFERFIAREDGTWSKL